MVKKGVESDWTVSNDRTMIALTMTFCRRANGENDELPT